MRAFAPFLLLIIIGTTAAAAQDSSAMAPATATSSATVEAVLAQTVVDRMPQDTGTTFPATVGELVLWTRVSGLESGAIHHLWFHGDEQVGDVELNVGGSPWRTWSRKTIPDDWTGAWHVEVRDGAGTVLKRIDFTIG